MRRRLVLLSTVLVLVMVLGLSGVAGPMLPPPSGPQAFESEPRVGTDLGPTSSSSSEERSGQPRDPIRQQPVPGDRPLPLGHPPSSRIPTGPRAPGLVQQRDLRRRIAEAVDLGRQSRSGEQAAKDAVAAQLAAEADPRVREALVTGEPPSGLGHNRGRAPPALPEPAAQAEPGEVRAYWVTPGSHGGTYESTVTVDGAGRAQVETVYEADNGEHWRVRYPAWAFRDAQGRLVVDARGQPVECLRKPEWGWWSPDSMVIGKDGLIDMIDDKHDPGQGTSGAKGPG